jgi:hypothetical protein
MTVIMDSRPVGGRGGVPVPTVGRLVGMRRSYVLVAAVVAAILLAGGAWWGIAEYRATHGPECTVPRPATVPASLATGAADAAPLGLDAVQLQHAATINAVGLSRGESERARVIALATAWQESSLRNIDRGDRDSLGLFQQRPSQGWGRAAQIMDPVYAAGQFFDHLAKVRGWQDMSLTAAAQAVQRSGHPDAYAKWEWDAQTLAKQLSGEAAPALSCRRGAHASTAEAPVRAAVPGTGNAAPRLGELLAAADAELTGVRADPASASGRGADVTIELPNTSAEVAARALAAWLVAHATTYGVTEVATGGAAWSGHRWQDAAAPPAGSVHVTVAD